MKRVSSARKPEASFSKYLVIIIKKKIAVPKVASELKPDFKMTASYEEIIPKTWSLKKKT